VFLERLAMTSGSTTQVAPGSMTHRFAGLESEHGGPVAEGRPANLCVIDPTAAWVVDPDLLASRSKNTPYVGRELTGRVRHTILRGEPVVVDGVATR